MSTESNHEIWQAKANGATLAEVADAFGITEEQARQAIAAYIMGAGSGLGCAR